MSESTDESKKLAEREYYHNHRNELPQSVLEAKKRFNLWRHKDPLPEIAPALLNSADIFTYICRTGMIYPFDLDKLSGASYEVRIKGKVVYWEHGVKKIQELKSKSDSFTLKPNSIAFVTLEPFFRLPDYIALRFNLKISHVYKGLLLGTGPLVDPGFVGRLSIPLHNLTSNEYVFHCLDDMIEMEFTKLSPNQAWHADNVEEYEEAVYKSTGIPPNRDVEDYLGKALKNRDQLSSIESSLPGTLLQMQENIDTAKEEVNELLKDARKNKWHSTVITAAETFAALVALATVVGFCVAQIGSLKDAYDDNMNAMQSQLREYEEEIASYQQEKDYDKQTIEELERNITNIQNQVDALTAPDNGK